MRKISLSIIIAIVGIISNQNLLIFGKTCNNKGPNTASQAFLDAHNNFRAKHQDTPPLVLDDELSEGAQACAQEHADCGQESKCWGLKCRIPFQDRDKDIAESFYLEGGFDAKPPSAESIAVKAVEIWYSEIKNYSYDDPERPSVQPNLRNDTHFAQVVWKSTEKLGYGMVVTQEEDQYQFYVIGRYFPGGNYRGRYAENVMPLK